MLLSSALFLPMSYNPIFKCLADSRKQGGTEGKNIILISTAKCLQLVCVKLLCFAQGQFKSIGCKKAFHDKLLLVKIKFITPGSCGCVLSSWGVKSSLQFNKRKKKKKSKHFPKGCNICLYYIRSPLRLLRYTAKRYS